mmetsp:Transcript_20233/g.43993  ORF Transcript_20233/g.43993 Transcript_20233/m.43993 type:complete len:627 (-) Transcript_20233:1152-3032(-)
MATMELPPPPKRIAVDVRVHERKKDGRTGTVIKAVGVGLRKWVIQFDGEDGTEVKSSASALQIYMEAYRKQDTPKKSLATSVQAAPPKTGRTRKAKKNISNDRVSGSTSEESIKDTSDDDDDFLGTESVASSDNSNVRSSSSEESFRNNSSSDEHSDSSSDSPRQNKKRSLFSSAKKLLSQRRRGGKKKGASLRGTRLFTPRPLSLSEDDSSSSSSIPCNNAVFTPEEGEGFDDAFEEEEDDNVMGDARVMEDSETPDGARVEFIDCPQKSALYHAAKREMEKKKESLIDEKHTIRVEVKTQHAYKFGGRVEGRPRTDFSGCRGTIIDVIDVIDEDRYMIQWDNDTTGEARKNQLLLSKEPNKILKWRVVRDHKPENPPSNYREVGVVGFNAETFNNIDTKSDDYDYPFSRLLEHLWPGDWRVQLGKMNDAIKEANKKLPARKHAKECSEDEWWTIWGIIIFAAKAGKGGISFLYNKTQKILDQLPNINLSDIMKQYRAQQLIKNINFAFYGEDVTDPWNPVIALVNGFNSNRAQKVAASHCKILDEVMSAWSPTTTKYGGLPFLSFILRKPQPLGTEFKNVACTEMGTFLHLEIQRGALPMQAKKYSKELGGTVGCSMRIIEASQ